MQYLSRAYNYYSGINPATLTGAIDVIVVRHVDSAGEVTLSGSPFHVRFGKLQVIRAGDKRVTVRLPNNLPAPHTAPFSMKVGDTGEAFFVIETDEEVPVDLMTSPVVMPSEVDTPAFVPNAQVKDNDHVSPSNSGPSLTQQPFGDTEQSMSQPDTLGDVTFLDLNDTPPKKNAGDDQLDQEAAVSTPSSMLDTAASLIPSIPFLTGRSSPTQEGGQPISSGDRDHDPDSRRKSGKPKKAAPPNPLTAEPGESTRMPSRDERLADVSSRPENNMTESLPKVQPGEGEGPRVIYGKDIVLDGAGYHSEGLDTNAAEGSTAPKRRSLPRADPEVQDSVFNTFARDLEAAIPSIHRPTLHLRATDPDFKLPAAKSVQSNSLFPDDRPAPARKDRATTEPPHDSSQPASPTLDPSSAALAMDYAWDWGRAHRGSLDESDPMSPVRRDTLPVIDHSVVGSSSTQLRGVEENPYLFVLEHDDRSHTFELGLCATDIDQSNSIQAREVAFLDSRVTFERFMEEPEIVDDPKLVIRYSLQYSTWSSDYRVLHALASYRHGLGASSGQLGMLPSLGDLGIEPPQTSGYAWSRWWRRSQASSSVPTSGSVPDLTAQPPLATPRSDDAELKGKYYAKTLRLSSDQLKQLNLKLGPNTVQFSVTSSYSGLAGCSARIFMWDSTDQIVISDIDGTITKSDALGHVYAAIGRDWTHLGIAKLYTDIANNGYHMLYLTSRAIGQADSTRGYLKSIVQGEYRLPEGPVIMSPDRLMASLHREVIMRKPELFKMACLRDIQRLFDGHAQEAFFAGFGNRITDAMSYRSVGIPAAKIYTIDSTGVVKTELLQAAGHKGSYIQLNDLVNEVFPPASTKFKPEFTDFNYWRSNISDIELPDLSPPSPALSARSDTSSRLSVFGKIAGLGRSTSRQPILPVSNPSSRPSSPLMGPSFIADDLSEPDSQPSSMPGSFEDKGSHFPAEMSRENPSEAGWGDRNEEEEYDYDDDDNFDDDLLATGEMRNVPF